MFCYVDNKTDFHLEVCFSYYKALIKQQFDTKTNKVVELSLWVVWSGIVSSI